MRYTPAQETQLANAMYQLEAAKATEINQNGKGQYYTRTGPMGEVTNQPALEAQHQVVHRYSSIHPKQLTHVTVKHKLLV